MSGLLQLGMGKIASSIVVVILGLVTVGTGVAGVAKVAGTIGTGKPHIVENAQAATNTNAGGTSDSSNSVVNSSQNGTQTTGSSGVLGASTNTGTTLKTNNTTTGAVVSAAATNTALNTTTSQASTSGGCIITLFGKQYDVTSLRTSHTGGNIFACGTDMTTTYQSMHGTDVTRMQAYLVTSSGNTGSGTTTGGSGNTGTGNTSGTGTSGGSNTPCIITLFGLQYNVAPLIAATPSSASIYKCGTDLSALYQSVHGTDVTIMKPYLISGQTGGSGSSGSGSGSNTGTGGGTTGTGGSSSSSGGSITSGSNSNRESKRHVSRYNEKDDDSTTNDHEDDD